MVWVTPEWLEARIEELETELKECKEEITRVEEMINKREEISRHHHFFFEEDKLLKLRQRHERIKLEIGRAQESLVMLKNKKNNLPQSDQE